MGRPRGGENRKTAGRRDKIRGLRAAGWTLDEIGRLFLITRQRVHQIAGDIEVEVQRERPVQWPIEGFGLRMRRWLWEAGWRKCKACKVWLCASEVFGPKKANSRCRECNAKRQRAYQKTEEGIAYRQTEHVRAQRLEASIRAKARRKAGLPLMTVEERRQIAAEASARRWAKEA